ncbi:hypothetical protein A9996_11505 [Gelidibacter algens]|nr:hypothetical protein A9996_11505 [Gelidibacter algens]
MVPLLSKSQTIVKDTLDPSFEWILPIIDYPFMIDAGQAEANRRVDGNSMDNGNLEFLDFRKGYRNLSMNQNTEMARNLHGTFYYGHNILWNKLLKPTTTKRYVKNRIFANISSLATDYLLTKLPYGYAYQHEEFHRSVMAVRGIYSYDEVWEFGKGFDIAVTRVKDEDLINLKKDHPADLVRLSAAGVEGEYAYFQRIKEDNFFDAAGYPSVGLMILGTLHAVNYVNLPLKPRFNRITDSILAHDQNDILARDFTGYDFSAWVYDLHRPYEPYEDRGEWPGGIGIRRPIKGSDLTEEMKDFLREAGTMQYLNFISPFIVGINQLQLNDNFTFNFALKSIPTSFGYYSGADLYLKINQRKLLLSLGANRSKNLTLPSIDLAFYDFQPKNNDRLNLDFKLALWLQPKNQYFFATNSSGGFSALVQPSFQLSKNISIYSDLQYKTKGWQFGNPYLDSNFSARLGLKIRTLNFKV